MGQDLYAVLPVVGLAMLIWLIGLSVFVYWVWVRFGQLGRGIKGGNLIKVLERVIETERENKKELKIVKEEMERFKLVAETHIQRVGLVRFNPFNETGGDQSFCLGLLDEKGDGIVLSCLHARDRTRVYAKPVSKGKSQYELSKEEVVAITKAQKGKK